MFRSLKRRFAMTVSTLLLRLFGWKMPAYFSGRDRLKFFFQGLEKPVVEAVRQLIKPGDVVLDIGANIGFLSRHFACLAGKNGRVVAFEPDPSTFTCLRFNTRFHRQVQPVNAAVSDTTGTCTLFLHPTSGMSNSLVHEWSNSQAIEVTSTTVDAWLSKHPDLKAPALVKIDVEGAEKRVLDGMNHTLKNNPDLALVVEFCPKLLGSGDRDLLEALQACRRTVGLISENGSIQKITQPEEIYQHLNKDGFVNLVCANRETF